MSGGPEAPVRSAVPVLTEAPEMSNDLVCWKCGASLADVLLPFGRRAECAACHAELHVCRMCEFYDPRVAQGCREPVADAVQDKQRANFCGYFTPRPDAHQPHDTAADQKAQAELAALFGDTGGDAGDRSGENAATDPARDELERLFGANDEPDGN